MRKMFPKHRGNIIASKDGRTAIQIAEMLYKEGFTDLVMVVGSDRVKEFSTLLNRYNDAPDKRGNQLFKFDSVQVYLLENVIQMQRVLRECLHQR